MLSRILFTIATAVSLTGLYAVYAVAIRPWVVIPDEPAAPQIAEEQSESHRPAENVRVAESYLTEQSWAAQSEYMLRAGQAFIFTNNWDREKTDQRLVHFEPFAMVWITKDQQGREQAVSLWSDSAQIKFASAFDDKHSNPGRVVGAVLDGEVQIKGPDGLQVDGKRFIFDESAPSLISTHPVGFRFGPHVGSGRSLHMSLIPAEGLPGRDRPHVFGIRSVRLSGGIDPATKKFEDVKLDLHMRQQDKPVVVNIRKAWELEYDVAAQTATFSKDVRVFHLTGPNERDGLDCDLLKIHFATKSKSGPGDSRNGSPDGTLVSNEAVIERKQPYQHISTDLVFERLTATGINGRKVQVVSQRNGLRAFMAELDYHALQRTLHMSDPKGVTVTQRGTTLVVPDIDVRFGERESLSEVLCRGAGSLETTTPGSRHLAFNATWAKQLSLTTDRATGLDVIQLDHKASFKQPAKRTGLGAERIRIWVASLSSTGALRMSDAPSGSSSPSAVPSNPAAEPDVKRLFAEGDVALVSPQLWARSQELDVRFDEAENQSVSARMNSRAGLIPAAYVMEETSTRDGNSNTEQPALSRIDDAPRVSESIPLRGGALPARSSARVAQMSHSTLSRPVADGSLGQPIDIPSSSMGTTGRNRLPQQSDSATEPLNLTADRIGVRLRKVSGQSQPEVTVIKTVGHVVVRQNRKAGELPLTAEGDRMDLTNEGPADQVIHLYGSPAHLRDRGVHIEGREVHLDRAGNRAWVTGHGLLQLPMPKRAPIAALGESTADPDLDVWWDESMEFNGQTAQFVGKVRAQLGRTTLRCELMDVALTERLSFSEQTLKAQPELQSISCREDVTFENSEYDGTKLVQVRRGKVAEFRFDRVKNTAFAQGPGHMQLWQRGKSSLTGGGAADLIQANRPITVVASDWNYTRVDFKGKMTGQIELQRAMFHDAVWIVHGPVKSPIDVLDRDKLTGDAGSMRCEQLEIVHQEKGPNNPVAYQQLVGHGNAQIEGRGFYATADEISFDGSKGLYMLRAHGKESATVARDSERGPPTETSARRIDFTPSRNALIVHGASGASGG